MANQSTGNPRWATTDATDMTRKSSSRRRLRWIAKQIADCYGMPRPILLRIMAGEAEIGGKGWEKARKGDMASIIFFVKE